MKFHAVYVTNIKRKSDAILKQKFCQIRVIQRGFLYKTYAENFGKIVYGELSLQTKLTVAKICKYKLNVRLNVHKIYITQWNKKSHKYYNSTQTV